MKIADIATLCIGAIAGFAIPLPSHPAPQLSGDLREFLAGWEMVDLPDGVGGTVRAARYTGTLQIVNGTGSTAATNRTGNLVVGYNALASGEVRTGSHMLVVGDHLSYDSLACGGAVFGFGNRVEGSFATVTGGAFNRAFGDSSSVSGGHGRSAIGGDDWAAGSLLEDH